MNQEVKALLADTDKVLIGIGESFERKDEYFNTDAFCMLEKGYMPYCQERNLSSFSSL